MTPRGLAQLLWDAYRAWRGDRATMLSAAVAYYALFSLAPVLIIAITIAGAVFGPQLAQQQAVEQIARVIGEEPTQAILRLVDRTRASRTGPVATLLSLPMIVYGASRLFSRLQIALNMIWEVESAPGGGMMRLIRTHLVGFVTVTGIGLMLAASILAGTALSIVRGVLERALAEQAGTLASALPLPHAVETLLATVRLWQAAEIAVSMFMAWLLFALGFRYLPETRITWRDVRLGAAVSAALFALGKVAIGLYLAYAGVASAYGAAGSLIVVLVWINYSAQALFFGAEITKLYATRYGSRRASPVR